MHIYSQTPTLVYILFNIYIHVSKYNLILYTYKLIYIYIYIYSCIHAHVCVLYSVCVRVYTHTKQIQRNESVAQCRWHHMDHIHTLKAIISTRRGPSTIEYGDGGSLRVRRWRQLNRASGRYMSICVCVYTHAHARTHAHKLIHGTIENHKLRCRRQNNS